MARLTTRFGSSHAPDPAVAVAEIRAAVAQPGMRAMLFFCSPAYDLVALGRELRAAFDCEVIGCTSAGQIGPEGYQRGGITAVSLVSQELTVHSHLIAPLSECRPRATAVAAQVRSRLASAPEGRGACGLLLVDGLALAEEALAATLYQSLGDVPLVGGSAGDDLTFERTAVYWEGTFLSDAAVLSILETTLPFATFKLANFRPTEKQLVTTAADPSARVVLEIDGLPAGEGYAAVLGLSVEDLDANVFSRHPLMLRIGSDYYLRSIQKLNPDGSLTFYCAIDEGLVLTVGEGLDPLAALEEGFRGAARKVGKPALVIGCDCILRRLSFEQGGVDREVGAFLSAHGVIGFSTYGEQFDSVHVNQTFTGIVLGG